MHLMHAWSIFACFQDVFLNKLLVSIKRKQKIKLTKEEGWYSAAELEELGWTQSGTYFEASQIVILCYKPGSAFF